MCRFYVSLFLILHQVVLSTSFECSPIACSGEKCNITIDVPKTVNTLEWRKDGVTQVSSSYKATNSCFPNPPSTVYAEYCFEDSTNRIYILEILNPEDHAGTTFSNPSTTDKTTIDLMEPDTLSSDDIATDIPSNITKDIGSLSVTVPCSKPQPTFTWNFKKSTTNFVNENSQISTDSTGCASSLMKQISTLNVADLDSNITETSGDIDISVDIKFGDCKTVSTKIVTTHFIVPGTTTVTPDTTLDTSTDDSPSPSSPSTPTQSSLPPNTSSTASSLTTASLTTASLTTQSVYDNIGSDGDLLVIIIVLVCLGTVIVVVVVLVCCCCPFCLCYKCCKKKHDEDIEGREKLCQCCCCPFCVCYKRKKKNDKKSNPPVTKTTTRSSQYEMNTSNSQNYRNNTLPPRATQPQHSYQDPRGYQFPRVYQTPRAHESYYGHGYNNAAFNYDENERGRNMTRKTRVPQRPYTNNYY